MNTLGQVVLVVGLTIIGAIGYWVYREDQKAPKLMSALEWERVTGIQVGDYSAWDAERIPIEKPISRMEFIRLAAKSPSKHRDNIP